MINRGTAKKEFREIKRSFKYLLKKRCTLEEMCSHFGGRLDPVFGLFDFDYKHLTATIFMQGGKPILDRLVEVWEENELDYRTEKL